MSILPHKQRVYTLIGIALAMFLGALDQTIVSPAMPRIVSELGGLDRYTWVTTIYLLISTLLVPIYGKLADILSRKALEIWSIATFLIGSMLCGLSGEFGTLPILGDAMTQLIIFRGIQGIGGAGLFSLAFIIVSDLYPPRERGKVGGIFGGVFGLSSVLGPLIGGFLTDNASGWIANIEGWRWIFYVNVPIGAIALWFIITRMPRLHTHNSVHKLNYVSALLMVLAFFPLVLGLQLDKSQHPWSSPEILGLLGSSAVMLAIWIWHSLKSEHPIIDLRLFANRVFTTGTIANFFFGAVFMGIIIFLPLYMVNVQDVSATSAGLAVIPLSLGVILGAGISGPLTSKTGRYKGLLVIGAVLSLLASILMTLLGIDSPMWMAVVFMTVAGISFGPAQSLYSLAIQNVLKPEEIGQGTSSIQFTRQIGSVVGAAIMGAILSSSLTAGFAANMPSSMGQGTMAVSQVNAKSPSETRTAIIAAFDGQISQLEQLFAARGSEADSLLAAFLADPAVSESSKAQLKDGTPAQQVARGFKRSQETLTTALETGSVSALEAVLASSPASAVPVEAVAGLRQAIRLPATQRAAMALRLQADFANRLGPLQDQVSAKAFVAIKQNLDKLKIEVGDAVSLGIRKTFAQGVHDVWLAGLVIAVLVLLSTMLIPNLELRGKGQKVEGEMPTSVGH